MSRHKYIGMLFHTYVFKCQLPKKILMQNASGSGASHGEDRRRNEMKSYGKVLVVAFALALALGGAVFAGGKAEAAGAKKHLTIGFNPMNTTMTMMKRTWKTSSLAE